MTGVFVAKSKDGVRVAVTGAGESGVFRVQGDRGGARQEIRAGRARRRQGCRQTNLMGDIHASPEYRANLIVVMAKRAVAQANG